MTITVTDQRSEPTCTPTRITRTLRNYKQLPSALASRVGTAMPNWYAQPRDCYGISREVLPVVDTEFVVLHTTFPDLAAAQDGDIPDGHSYAVFANVASLEAFMRDTNGSPRQVRQNMKSWKRNLSVK